MAGLPLYEAFSTVSVVSAAAIAAYFYASYVFSLISSDAM
jgi:hypothetical protein